MPFSFDATRGSSRYNPGCNNRAQAPLDPPETSDEDQCREPECDADPCLGDFLLSLELD